MAGSSVQWVKSQKNKLHLHRVKPFDVFKIKQASIFKSTDAQLFFTELSFSG